MSHDLLVYGGGELRQLIAPWLAATSRAGVTLGLHPRFDAAIHGGFLPLRIELDERAPCAGVVGARGPLAGGVELFLEFFEPPDPPGELTGGIDPAMERATFCAIFQLSAGDGPASCIAGFVGAVCLAEVSGGVVVEAGEGRQWSPPEAARQAERYLIEVLEIGGCERVEGAFEGWAAG
jgi:hypothetical protein